MGRHSKRERNTPKGAEGRMAASGVAVVTPQSAIENAPALLQEASTKIDDAALAQLSEPPKVAAVYPDRVRDAYVAAFKAKQAFELAEERCRTAESKWLEDHVSLEKATAECAAAQAKLAGDGSQLVERERKVADAEADALRDFESKRKMWAAEWEALKNAEQTELQRRISESAEAERQLQKLRRQHDRDRAILDEDEQELNDKIARRAEKLAAGDRQDKEALQQRLERASASLASLQTENEELQRGRWAGGGDAKLLATRHRELEAAYQKLSDSVANYPPPEDIERLRADARVTDSLRDQVASLIRENGALTVRFSRMVQSAGELESLRDMKEAAEAQLKVAREQLGSLIEQIEGQDGHDQTFPQLAQIDGSDEYQTTPISKKWSLTNGLEGFVKDLQQKIRHQGFEYSLVDLRCFVAGMAMSRLHILEGISGTGKTSLPLKFASSTKCGVKVIEVQAGWRDRQDLVGYYNAFEKTYRQTEFVRALYEAQTPRYRDSPYIIVLDEMNLSRPEQYFADLLSVLEREPGDQQLILLDREIEDAPKLFLEGRKLAIPQNVWFVGTANHDETTLEFADKTYDRAHVIELPRQREHVQEVRASAGGRLEYGDLRQAFVTAQEVNVSESDKARKFFEKYTAQFLDAEFGIGLSNRLMDRQLGAFVPVFKAAGGEAGEAIDHILTTRLLRKVAGLHDTTGDQFRNLARKVQEGWSALKLGPPPMKTINFLDRELRLKEPGNTVSVWQ